ncbi:hypothetical protein [Tumebacillus flagellatus]|uniref:hypothetical protein n=1 Tax=Tumebacillus flagellatus TaxID=1157490 RepID=UPI001268A0DE|nr:hypothetical protein [Tumebacillus flagellatus]
MKTSVIARQRFSEVETESKGVSWGKLTPRSRKKVIICRIRREREAWGFCPERSTHNGPRWVEEYHLCRPCLHQEWKQPVHAC